jgi:hypothetical protein
LPLYPQEDEVAKAVLGRAAKVSQWRALAAVLERHGFPQIDPLMGGRYWPAVVAYFNRRHGLADTVPLPAADGIENWPCKPSSRHRDSG